MSYQWDFYFAEIERQPASVLVDVGIHDAVPDYRREHLYWVLLQLNDPSPEGLTTPAESPILWYIESSLASHSADAGARFVGRITTAGRREFYFYAVKEALFDEAVRSALAAFPRYQFEIGDEGDPGWAHYRDFLYPDEEAFRTIENRGVIQSLQEAGDDLSQPRPIRHFVNFKDDSSRAAFANLAGSLGYTADEALFPDKVRPFRLVLHRVEQPDPVDLDCNTLTLYRHAIEFDGEYDGWDSPVVRRDNPILAILRRLFRLDRGNGLPQSGE